MDADMDISNVAKGGGVWKELKAVAKHAFNSVQLQIYKWKSAQKGYLSAQIRGSWYHPSLPLPFLCFPAYAKPCSK